MPGISNVDHVLMLLRQQLQRTGKTDEARRPSRQRRKGMETRKPAAGRIEEVSRTANLSDDELSRSLITALLIDEFGEAIANDPRFQRLAGEVHRIISSDTEARDLLRTAIQAVKAGDRD